MEKNLASEDVPGPQEAPVHQTRTNDQNKHELDTMGGRQQARPEHSWRRGNRPWKKIWQLEPLFLVLFLKSIIRNFQYRNNPSKPFKSFVVQQDFHIRSTRTSVQPCDPTPPPIHAY